MNQIMKTIADNVTNKNRENRIRKSPSFSSKTVSTVSTTPSASSLLSTTTTTNTCRRRSRQSMASSSLAFDPQVRVRSSLSICDYTDDEIESCWYTPTEYQQILHHREKEIKKLQHGKKLHDKKYCSRGLEHSMQEDRIIRDEIIQYSIAIVLTEQEYQRTSEQPYYDDYDIAIANEYGKITSECESIAHTIGLLDEKEARRYNSMDEQHQQGRNNKKGVGNHVAAIAA